MSTTTARRPEYTSFLDNMEFKRWAAVTSHVVWGKSYREIADKLQCDHSWVGKLVRKFYDNDGQLVDQRQYNGGSNAKLTDDTHMVIEEFYRDNRNALNREVIAHVESSTGIILGESSLKTAKRTLGFIGTKPKIIRDITPANINKRLQYCQKHIVDKFTNCLFTDESSIQLFENKSLVWWQPYYETRPEIEVQPSKEKIMIWGGISRKVKTKLSIIRTDLGDTVDKEAYLEILKKFAHKTVNKGYGAGRWRLMHDNARPHKAKIVTAWLQEKEIRALDHPPYSPDLNPIEKVWGIIKQRLYHRRYEDIEELIDAVTSAWNDIDLDLINRLIDNHIGVVDMVHNLDGNYI